MAPPALTVKEATSVEFWRELCPDLTIEGPGEVPGARIPSPPMLREAIRTEGYINEPDVLPAEFIGRLRRALQALHARGIPPAFAFVYDEFWTVFAALSPYLSEVLGADYRVLPAFWAWYVEPTDAASGWTPHRDRPQAAIGADNIPDSLSIWLPLTHATPLNGCMYIVPAHWDNYFEDREAGGKRTTVLEGAQLQNIRALPAAPGSLLSWNQSLFHWGGRASRMGTEPRCSISVEFQRGDRPAMASPLIRPRELLPFRTRLGLIGHQFRVYLPFHRMDRPELISLATALEWKYYPKPSPAGPAA